MNAPPTHRHPTAPFWSIGLIGFSYAEWAGTLYASDHVVPSRRPLRGDQMLKRYAAYFNAVEVNTTFYGVPSAATVRSWNDATPPHFQFCVKMPRDVSHGPTPRGALAAPTGSPVGHLLRDETVDKARRFIDAVAALGPKLASVLLQFPAKFTCDRLDELAGFVDRLGKAAPLAIEFRNDGWWTDEARTMMRDRNVCWVSTDESNRHDITNSPGPASTDAHHPRPIMLTSDFLYVRWLGVHEQFADRLQEHFDPTARLEWWRQRLRATLREHPAIRGVYGLFDNDFAGHAPATAHRFAQMVGLSTPKPRSRGADEPTLFT